MLSTDLENESEELDDERKWVPAANGVGIVGFAVFACGVRLKK